MEWREVGIDAESHLKRVLEMYDELGFVVRLEEVSSQEVESCTRCIEEAGEKMYRVFVAGKRGGEE